MNVRRLLDQAGAELANLPGGRLDAEVLMCEALGVSRAWIYANSDKSISEEHYLQFRQWVERRINGEPVAYITGKREFWSLPLKVTPDVLIPRPETELLVETVLSIIPENARWRIADLGTGSGAIALAIASERPHCEVHATDISERALKVARENAHRLNLKKIIFSQGSWLSALTGRFHLIVSNPPYIHHADSHLAEGDCRFEPEIALTPGNDGMESLRIIASGAIDYLAENGTLAIEHGYDQGNNCRELLEKHGYQQVRTIRDLAGLERVTTGKIAST